jgi:hypothetical protein
MAQSTKPLTKIHKLTYDELRKMLHDIRHDRQPPISTEYKQALEELTFALLNVMKFH